MPEEDYSAAEVKESSEVFGMIFPPDDEASELWSQAKSRSTFHLRFYRRSGLPS